MIKVSHLRKTFASVIAVDDVSFEVKRGEIFGLLGPNGAGKTSTLRMMYGIFKPTSGHVDIDGLNVQENTLAIQKRIGVLPDGGGIYKRLSARENIQYFGELHGMNSAAIAASIDKLSKILGMDNILERKTAGFSQGERMKVSLARAIVHDPDYVFLDEPTNGLDVLTTRAVRKLLLNLKVEGKSVIFSSHLMNEVANLCDRVGIIAKGKLVAEGRIDTILQTSSSENFEEAFVKLAYPKQDVYGAAVAKDIA